MATPPPQPVPLILDDVELKIDGDSLKCLLNHIEVAPDISTIEITTMCGAVDYPGTIKWLLRATVYQSFDAGGSFEILQTVIAAGVAVPFEVVPRGGQAVSVTNPRITGDVIPQPIPLLAGDAGDASTIDIEWSIIGEPTVATTLTTQAEQAAA